MRHFQTFYIPVVLLSFLGCNSENRNNSRAYVEGNLTGNVSNSAEIELKIRSANLIIAEAIPDTAGKFEISGPLVSDSFSLYINRKIKSFSTTKMGCSLSSDSLEIIIPSGTTYIVFNEILLK